MHPSWLYICRLMVTELTPRQPVVLTYEMDVPRRSKKRRHPAGVCFVLAMWLVLP